MKKVFDKNVAKLITWFREEYDNYSRDERMLYIMKRFKVGSSQANQYHHHALKEMKKEVRILTNQEKELIAGKVKLSTLFVPTEEIKRNFDYLVKISKGEYDSKLRNKCAKELVRMNTHFGGVIRVLDAVRLDDRLHKILYRIAEKLGVPSDRKSLQPDVDRLMAEPELWLPFDESFEFDQSINDCLGVFVQSRNSARAIFDRISAVEMMNRVLENQSYRINDIDDDMIGKTALKRMRAIFGMKEWNTDECKDMVLGGYWRPFQKRWIEDRSRLKIVEKSRRTGYTFGSSFAWSLEALEFADDAGIWISRSEKLAKQFSKDYLTGWAKIINYCVEVAYINLRNITAGQADYPNGHKIIMASSNPDAVAGFGGKIGLDEYALNPSAEKLYDIALPAIMYGHRLEIVSTHRGRGQFYYFIQEAKEPDTKWSYHRANIKDAIADGLVRVVNNARIKSGLEPQTDNEFYREIRESCRSEEAFLQEYMCTPADDINAVLTYDLIRSCTVPNHTILDKDTDGRQYFGYDFGLSVNPSAMVRLEETKDAKLTTREIKLVKEPRFKQQKMVANRMMDKCHRGSMDAGAQGSQMAQDLEEEYMGRFEGVMLTGSNTRAELANLMWRMFDEGKIIIPDDDDLIEHLFSVKKDEQEGRQTRIYCENTSNKNDHSDYFWALALALYSHGGYTHNETVIRRLPRSMRRSEDVFTSNFY